MCYRMHTTNPPFFQAQNLRDSPSLVLRDSISERFSSAQIAKRFRQIFCPMLLARWYEELAVGTFYQRAFTPLITLWYLVFQQVQADHTLARVVDDARSGGANALSPPGKALSGKITSSSTASYCLARQRFPLKVLSQAVRHSGGEIRSWTLELLWRGWNVVLMDGSTVRLRPLGSIPQRFSAHPGASKVPYWCLMRVVAAFCAKTGVVLASAQAPNSTSEQRLAGEIVGQLPSDSLVVADRNFGVFSVIHALFAAKAQGLIRLTEARARKLVRENMAEWKAEMDLPVQWTPSRHDQVDAHLPPGPVAGRLLALRVHRPGFRSDTLYLFTTLRDPILYPAHELLELYAQRWQVELNLRYLKDQMDLESLDCQSDTMAEKLWLAGLLAYNLIRSLMVATAAKFHLSLHSLSFSRARTFLQIWLAQLASPYPPTLDQWDGILQRLSGCLLPTRKLPRPTEPRAKRYFQCAFPQLKGSRTAARAALFPIS